MMLGNAAILARVPLLRLLRTPRSWLPIALWSALALVSSIIVRSRGVTTGADQVMRGVFGVVVVPLAAFTIVSATLGAGGMRRAIRGVVSLGASPREAALASTLVAVGMSMIVCAALGVTMCAVAHGAGDPPLVKDLVASLWIGGMGGGAYGAYFAAGSAIGRGAMRGAFLALDWILGSTASVGAAFLPRGHVTSLLGGPLAAELPARASSIVLFVLLVVYAALAVALTRRA